MMWVCKANVAVVSILAICMMEWNDLKGSSALVDAAEVNVDGVPTKVVYYSRKRDLWSQRGIRSLLRAERSSGNGTTASSEPFDPRNLDPIADSADLPSCIEICLIQNCYGGVQATQATNAPTTAP